MRGVGFASYVSSASRHFRVAKSMDVGIEGLDTNRRSFVMAGGESTLQANLIRASA